MRVFLFLCFTFVSGLYADQIAYVADNQGNAVSIVDITTNTVTGYVNNNGFNLTHPIDVTFNVDGTKAYVVCDTLNQVAVIDVATNTVVRTVDDSFFPFSAPAVMIVNGSKGYVTNEGNNTVSIINLITDVTIGYVNTGGFPFNLPIGISNNSAGTRAYVTNFNGNNVSIINLATDTVTGYVTDVGFPFVQPILVEFINNSKAYVTSLTNLVSVIDVLTNTVIGYIDDTLFPFNGPIDTIPNPEGTKVYVSNMAGGQVSIVDPVTDTVIGNVSGSFSGPLGIAFSFDGASAYITNSLGNTVSVVNAPSDTVTGTVNSGAFPFTVPYQIALQPSTTPPPPPPIMTNPPTSVVGRQVENRFLTQTDIINVITWKLPIGGFTPIAYKIYRDSALTILAQTIPANDPLIFVDHNRKKRVYVYYIVAIGFDGGASLPVQVIITPKCH